MKRRSAFTLIEFLIYFGLIAIMASAITVFTVDILKTRTKAQVISEVEQNVRFSMLRVLRATRRATAIDNAGSTFDNDAGVLSLNQDETAKNPTVFDLQGGVLRMKEGAGAATPITSSDVVVTKLRFSKDSLGSGGKSVTAEITVRYAAASTEKTFDYTVSASTTGFIRKD
jgi:type II secretory pathway pseudopilin PulG